MADNFVFICLKTEKLTNMKLKNKKIYFKYFLIFLTKKVKIHWKKKKKKTNKKRSNNSTLK